MGMIEKFSDDRLCPSSAMLGDGGGGILRSLNFVLRTLVIFLVFCFDLFLECLLEPSAGRRGGNVLIVALYELATGDVIRDLLRLPKLPVAITLNENRSSTTSKIVRPSRLVLLSS